MATQPIMLRNFGGIHQLYIANDADLSKVDGVDAARWAATSAPTRDLHCDAGFLSFVDTEGKGRIRVVQLLAARDWFFARIKDRTRLKDKSDELILDAIDFSREEGKTLRHAAEHVIAQLQLSDTAKIKLSDVRAFRASYAKTLANGDGVVPAESCPDAEVAAFIKDLIGIVGSAPDASGAMGIGEAQLARFLDGGHAFVAWKKKGTSEPAILPLGDATDAAIAAIRALDAKIEEFFLKCDLLKQEELTAVALKLSDEEWKAIRSKDSAALEKYLAESTLSVPTATGALSLAGSVNPSFQPAWDALNAKVLSKFLRGEKALTRGLWQRVKANFDANAAWRKEKPIEPFDALPTAKLEAYLSGPLPGKLTGFIQTDKAAAPELAQVINLEKLILFQRWLIEFANNFVNFSALYHPDLGALVDMGTMIIDGRRLEFCLKVEDRAAHKKVASESLIFLVYAQITEQDGMSPVYEVVAPVTNGERGRLRVGKRGIFIDTAGREWDATVVDLVENAISIKEAMFAPFRRAQKFIHERIESFTQAQLASREKAMTDHAASSVDRAGTTTINAPVAAAAAVANTPKPTQVLAAPKPVAPPPHAPAATPAPAPAAGGGMQNLLVGGSIAFAAIGSAMAYVVSAISSIVPMKLLLSLLGLVAFILALSAFLGWLKLRRRDMGLLFEAAGWAINVEMKITRRVAVTFTKSPDFPEGTRTDNKDVLADSAEVRASDKLYRRRRRRIGYLVFAAVLVSATWYFWPHLLKALGHG